MLIQSNIQSRIKIPGNYDLVFRSLCALLAESPEGVEWSRFSDQDWGLFEEAAVGEGVAPMAYYLLHSQPEMYHFDDFDKQTYQILSEREAECAVRNAILFKKLSVILQAFQTQKLPVTLLKGADFAKSLYPEPGLRPMGDLDLFVPRALFSRALTIVENLGYHEYLPEAMPGLDRTLNYHTHNDPRWHVPHPAGTTLVSHRI